MQFKSINAAWPLTSYISILPRHSMADAGTLVITSHWSRGVAFGMSPSSVIVISGVRGFRFDRPAAGRKTGGSFVPPDILCGEKGSERFRIEPPRPAIQSSLPPHRRGCSVFPVSWVLTSSSSCCSAQHTFWSENESPDKSAGRGP